MFSLKLNLAAFHCNKVSKTKSCKITVNNKNKWDEMSKKYMNLNINYAIYVAIIVFQHGTRSVSIISIFFNPALVVSQQ